MTMTDSGAREAVKIDTDGVAHTVRILGRAITTVLGKGWAESIAAALRADLTTYVASVADAQVREEREAIQDWHGVASTAVHELSEENKRLRATLSEILDRTRAALDDATRSKPAAIRQREAPHA